MALFQCFFGVETIGSIIASAVSAVLLGLNIYMKGEDLGALVRNHGKTASDIWLIREKYQSLITDLVIREETIGNRTGKKGCLNGRIFILFILMLHVPHIKLIKKAQQSLKYSEDMTFFR